MELKTVKKDAFLTGYRKIFDPYNDVISSKITSSYHNSDRENLQSDWTNVGKDIEKAMANYESKQCK